ncbi:hypothetical protein B0H66DRAFT_464775, partial [Apodospora peruviana]
GWTGRVDHTAPASLVASSYMQQVDQDWYVNNTIGNIWSGTCEGECHSTIEVAGVAVACKSATQYVDLTTPENANTTLFGINFTRFDDASETPVLRMMVMYSANVDSSCNATIHIDTCDFRSAVVKYNVAMYGKDFAMQVPDLLPEMMSLNQSAGDGKGLKKNPISAGRLSGLEWFGHYY